MIDERTADIGVRPDLRCRDLPSPTVSRLHRIDRSEDSRDEADARTRTERGSRYYENASLTPNGQASSASRLRS